jgi:steroid delta-isomerase-like uncharacterized protein
MSTSDLSPKAVGLRWFHEVWQKRNADAISSLLTPDAKGHLEGGQEIVGPNEFIGFHRELLSAMPDMKLEVLRVLADGENVCLHWQITGTHAGHGFGMKPTGKELPFSGMSWFIVKDGRIVEGWDCWNQARMTATMAGLA